MKRGEKQLKRTRLNPVSKKTRKRNSEYSEIRKKILEEEPNCVARLRGCQVRADQIHHVQSRGVRPDRVLDEHNLVPICWYCHRIITDNPQMGYDLGLMKKSHEE